MPQNVLLRASARFTSPRQDLLVLNWAVPQEIEVADVSGPSVHSWSRQGSNLQIWLEHGTRDIEVHLNGSSKYLPGSPPHFLLPCMHFPGIPTQSTVVTVSSGQGVAIKIESMRGMNARTSPEPSPADIILEAGDADYAATLAIDLTKAVAKPPTIANFKPHTQELENRVEVRTRHNRLLFDEQAASVLGGSHWLHRATYWLHQGTGAGLGVMLPPGSSAVRIVLDGKEIPTLETVEGKYWVPATGLCRIRTLILYWRYSPDQEGLAQPRLAKPVLEGDLNVEEDSIWTIYPPAGYRSVQAGEALRQTRAALDLRRARALLAVSEELTDQTRDNIDGDYNEGLLNAQVSFYRYCRDAQRRWRKSQEGVSTTKTGEGIGQLLEANKRLAEKMNFQNLRSEAESASRLGSAENETYRVADSSSLGELFGSDETPIYLTADSKAEVPNYRVELLKERGIRHRLGTSAIMLLLALIAGLLPYRPRMVEWIFFFWPVELLGLSVLTWPLLGPNWVSVVLCVAGLSTCLFYLARRLFDFLRPRRPPLAASGPSEGSPLA
jgi:hypothetical protein